VRIEYKYVLYICYFTLFHSFPPCHLLSVCLSLSLSLFYCLLLSHSFLTFSFRMILDVYYDAAFLIYFSFLYFFLQCISVQNFNYSSINSFFYYSFSLSFSINSSLYIQIVIYLSLSFIHFLYFHNFILLRALCNSIYQHTFYQFTYQYEKVYCVTL
jgi:hypothetical protein